MEPIVARWTWLHTDMEEGREAVLENKRLANVLRTFAPSLVATIVLLRAFGSKNPGANLVALTILVVAIVVAVTVVTLFISPALRKRAFIKRPDANQELTWSINDEEIVMTSPDTRSEVRWPHFYKILSTPTGFLFLPNAQIFQFVPNRAFQSPDDIETLKLLARGHAKDYKELR